MKNLLIGLVFLAFSGVVSAETHFSITTKVTKNGEVTEVQSDSIAPGEEVIISERDLYDLSITTIENGEGKALIKVVLKTDSETQTPTLLAEFGEEVGFELHGTSVYMVVSKT